MTPHPDAARELLHILMAENRQHARLSEDRRIAVTGVTAIAASATLIALAMMPTGQRTLPLALWLTAFGVLSTAICLKLYERAQFHERRARALRTRLVEMAADTGIDEAQRQAEADHSRAHPRLSALRLNTLLVAVNVAASLLGLLYVVLDLAVSR